MEILLIEFFLTDKQIKQIIMVYATEKALN